MADQNMQPEEEPISIESSEQPASSVGGIRPSGMRTFGNAAARTEKVVELNRQVNCDGTGAVRCRIFYSKVSVAALAHMESQINQWLDTQAIEIKHIAQIIGVMEGKTPEPNLIVTVWY